MESDSKLNSQQDFCYWQGPLSKTEESGDNNKNSRKWEQRFAMQMATKLSKQDTDIVDLGASGWYFTPDATVSNVNKTTATICVGTVTGQSQHLRRLANCLYLTFHQAYLDI